MQVAEEQVVCYSIEKEEKLVWFRLFKSQPPGCLKYEWTLMISCH